MRRHLTSNGKKKKNRLPNAGCASASQVKGKGTETLARPALKRKDGKKIRGDSEKIGLTKARRTEGKNWRARTSQAERVLSSISHVCGVLLGKKRKAKPGDSEGNKDAGCEGKRSTGFQMEKFLSFTQAGGKKARREKGGGKKKIFDRELRPAERATAYMLKGKRGTSCATRRKKNASLSRGDGDET